MINNTFRRARQGLTLSTLLLMLPAHSAFSVVIPGDPADGRIRADNGTVATGSEVLPLGYRGSNGVEQVTSIALFQLPDFSSSAEIDNAALEFTFLDAPGSHTNVPTSTDGWGLGYVSTTAIDTNWHLMGDADTRTGNDLGTGIGTNPVVKIADDFLDVLLHEKDPTPVEPYRMVLPTSALSDFIGMLYDQGAVSGDYAVIRFNVDAVSHVGTVGFDLASANATNEATRPVLSINESTTLLLDPFTDGDRYDRDDPLDTDWYTINSSLNLTVLDDSAGIGDGNALEVIMVSGGKLFVCGFPEVVLEEPGDFVHFSCVFRPTFISSSNDENFRIGVLSSGENPVVTNLTSSSSVNNYGGYMIRMSSAVSGDLATINTVAGDSFLGSSGSISDFLKRKEGAIAINNSTIYSLTYTITRASDTQMTTRVHLNDVTLNGMDPGNDGDIPDHAFVDTFDALGWGTKSGIIADFILDNVTVQTSVPLVNVVTHSNVTAEVIELQVDTQPNVRYSLQQATDLASSNWVNSGYILTGDGNPLRVFDPNADEPEKSYRMESQ